MGMVFVPPEGGRYATSLVFVPGLWTPAAALRGLASFLGHRGWEGRILELVRQGGLRARVDVVLAAMRATTSPPVLVGHGAGSIVALEASRQTAPGALALLCPTLPGSPASQALTRRWEALSALALGRDVPPPAAGSAGRIYGPTAAPALESDTREAVLDVVRGRLPLRPVAGIPTLVVSSPDDPLLGPESAVRLATTLAATHRTLPGGHWTVTGPRWKEAVGVLHRWLVQSLGESLLELYEEAMADRGDEPDGS
jgi:predicted alpha/beta hydrolase family esterase